jgi:hypothetical protein
VYSLPLVLPKGFDRKGVDWSCAPDRTTKESDMKVLRVVFAFVALSLLAEAQVLKTVKVNYDEKVDFSKYKTFAWSEAQESVSNPANHIRITRAVERELAAKGLLKADTGSADLRVRYLAKIEKKLKSTARQESSSWDQNNLRTMVDLTRVEEGTLILELSDGASGDVVWRAVNVDVAPRSDLVPEAIDKWMKKIVAPYPPKAKPAP